MKRKPKVGDRITLLVNRGKSKKGDTLNIETIYGNTFETKEMFNNVERHNIGINYYNIQWVYTEEYSYELY